MKQENKIVETETQENNVENVGWQVFSNQPRYATFNNKKSSLFNPISSLSKGLIS